MKQLDKYHNMNLNLYQMREIELGYRNGLTIEQVDLYAKPEYDSLQMKEIRLGFEMGLSEQKVRSFADPEMDADAMNHMRVGIDRDEAVTERKQTELRNKKLKSVFLCILIIACGIGGSFAGYLFKGDIQEYTQELNIEFTENEVTIGYGEDFVPMKYIKDYTKGNTVELILPDSIDTHSLGDKKVLYKLKNRKKVKSEELIVHVVDNEKPVLVLNRDEVELIRIKDSFDPKEYVEEAMDAVDGNLKNEVRYSDIDTTKDKQTVTFSVTDKSGNEATAELILVLKDPEVPKEEPVVIAGDDQPAQEYVPPVIPTQPVQPQAPVTVPTGGSKAGETKMYWFADGYDIDSAFSACQVDGNAYGAYACDPVMADGLYVGYRLTYK